MAADWSTRSADYLDRTNSCPRCGSPLVTSDCSRCGADLASPVAHEVRRLSVEAAELLRRRAEAIAALPIGRVPVGVGAAAGTDPGAASVVPGVGVTVAVLPASVAIASAPVLPAAALPARSSVTLQSVMAVAGAGLIAVAAVVFAYLNPDLRDLGARVTVLLVVTALMAVGAMLLGRAGLRFSAEAVGALAGILVALVVQSIAQLVDPAHPWAAAALGCLLGSSVLGVLGWGMRLRTWVWIGALGLGLTPALLGYSGAEPAPTLGHLGAIAVSLLVQPLLARAAGRMGSPLTAARTASTVFRLVAVALTLLQLLIVIIPFGTVGSMLFRAVVVLALAVGMAVASATQLRRTHAVLAGALATLSAMIAATTVPLLPGVRGGAGWTIALIAAASALAVIALAIPRAPARFARRELMIGGAAMAAAVGAVLVLLLGVELLSALAATAAGVDERERLVGSTEGTAMLLGFGALAAGSFVVWRLTRRRSDTARLARVVLAVGLWIVPVLGLAVLGNAWPPVDVAVGSSLAPGVGAAIALVAWPRVRRAPAGLRVPLAVAAHLAPVVAAPIAVQRGPLAAVLAFAVLLAWALAAAAAPRRIRIVHAVAGHAYALLALGASLSVAGLGVEVALPIVAIVSAGAAVVVTLLPRVPAVHRLGALCVAAVPFLAVVAEVLEVRTGWTAAAALAGAVLAAVLAVARRDGITAVPRAIGAALVVPSLAVALVCLGAQVLAVSASPVVLPVVAALVALALPTTGAVQRMLLSRGVPEAPARAARLAIEASALVTGAVAVLLALVRVAAGAETAFAVLVIVGLGSVATGLFVRRRYAWVVAFWSFSGALWTLLSLVRVTAPEAYALPPALVAATIAAVLVLRGSLVRPARALFAVAMAVAPIPSLAVALLAVGGDASAVVPRVVGLLLGGALATAASALLLRRGDASRARPLVAALAGAGIAAGAAGPIAGVRVGSWLDPTVLGRVPESVWPALGLSLAGVFVAAAGGAVLARMRPAVAGSGIARRWVALPAAAYLVAGPIASTHRGWAPIWVLWALALLLLLVLVATAARAARRPTVLPPVWAIFPIAWVTAVAGWSMRDLRVEVFSLPLGLALLAAGVIGLRTRADAGRRDLDSWPHGFVGSWPLLAPGMVVTLLPSILATGTDPQTWRAILVLGLALAAILIGSLRRLAAPFVLGIAVLPIENLVVFGAQLGRTISATSWWISLATAGAVLLVIAVTAERRTGGGGIAARMRDLR